MVAVDSQTRTMLWLMKGELLEADRVHSIIGAFFKVYNYYGYGLSEAIYAGALEYELTDRGHEVVRELLVGVVTKAVTLDGSAWTWLWIARSSSRTKQQSGSRRPLGHS